MSRGGPHHAGFNTGCLGQQQNIGSMIGWLKADQKKKHKKPTWKILEDVWRNLEKMEENDGR